MKAKISIIIPIYNEEKYIQNCIESILQSDYPEKSMEILLVDGMSDDKTREIITRFQQRYDCIRLLDNVQKIVPIAMNIGIKQACGEYLFRLDAHAVYPEDYFSRLVECHQKLDADNVGAMILTEVKNSTPKGNSIKEVLSHKLGVGNSLFRTSADKIMEVDTVPFGCFKKEVFEKYGYYDERLIRNQDIELNKRIVKGGGKIYLIPDIKATYYARENFRDLAKNSYANGYWNILTAYYTKSFDSLGLRHYIPLLFVLSLLLPSLLSLFWPKILWIAAVSLVSYLFLVIITTLKIKNRKNSLPYLIASFLTLHFSYGAGSLMGISNIVQKMIKGAHHD